MDYCECGLKAAGFCKQCGRAVCGRHSAVKTARDFEPRVLRARRTAHRAPLRSEPPVLGTEAELDKERLLCTNCIKSFMDERARRYQRHIKEEREYIITRAKEVAHQLAEEGRPTIALLPGRKDGVVVDGWNVCTRRHTSGDGTTTTEGTGLTPEGDLLSLRRERRASYRLGLFRRVDFVWVHAGPGVCSIDELEDFASGRA